MYTQYDVNVVCSGRCSAFYGKKSLEMASVFLKEEKFATCYMVSAEF